MNTITALFLMLSMPLLIGDSPGQEPTTLASLEAQIASLKATWREIAWKSCLLEGLKESREKKKPVLLWVFIDRQLDDARC